MRPQVSRHATTTRAPAPTRLNDSLARFEIGEAGLGSAAGQRLAGPGRKQAPRLSRRRHSARRSDKDALSTWPTRPCARTEHGWLATGTGAKSFRSPRATLLGPERGLNLASPAAGAAKLVATGSIQSWPDRARSAHLGPSGDESGSLPQRRGHRGPWRAALEPQSGVPLAQTRARLQSACTAQLQEVFSVDDGRLASRHPSLGLTRSLGGPPGLDRTVSVHCTGAANSFLGSTKVSCAHNATRNTT